MTEFNKRDNLANKDNVERIDELVSDINSILEKYNIEKRINKSMIRFNADYIGNILYVKDKTLSHIIFNHYFPKPNKKTFYHYTTFQNAENIIKSKKLRLYNLNKRFSDGEFQAFYEEHGMDGYKDGKVIMDVDCSTKGIMSDIYYISLTGSGYGTIHNNLWKDFGEDGEGIRLEFSVTPKTDDFREVYYSKNNDETNIPLLKNMFNSIKNKYGKPLNFTNSSKIGSFYIRGKFKNENEYRLIIKRDSDDYGAYHLEPNVTNNSELISYIEIPFKNKFAEFELKSIQLGYECSDDDEIELNQWIKNLDIKPNIINKANKEE
ncbi:hypothetical protein H7F37_04450 [Winogradskyella sp. PAMC22761]|nr:hypothetical protein H7F37_04450 [Winogradskyella sp. PAMC22761]